MKNLYQRINDIQKKVVSVHKGSRVEVVKGKYYSAVSHDDIAALLHLPMAEAGISVEVDMIECSIEPIAKESIYNGQKEIKYSYLAKVKMAVTFVNSDDPKERFTVNSYGYAFDSGDKAIGKAESMAVKYVYLKNFNLESTDDEESRSEENSAQFQTTESTSSASEHKQTQTMASQKQVDLIKKHYPSLDTNNLTMKKASELIASAMNKRN